MTQLHRSADDDRAALLVWLAGRVSVAVLALAAGWMVIESVAGQVPSWLSSWDRWDAQLFVKIARFGYNGYPTHYPDKGVVAFFPGEPLALRAVHLVVRNWTASGLLISAVAGGFAVVALARLGNFEGGHGVGRRAVLYLTVSPYAVFLAAGYSESLFLGCALWSWVHARERRWLAAGLLGGAAATVRVTGVFLGLALVVEWWVSGGARRVGDAAALAVPFVATGGYVVYLHGLTGDWLAWPHAQRDEWHRSLTAPWHALSTTWQSATDAGMGNAYVWSFRAEIVAVLVGVVLTVVLLALRRWAEFVYVGGQVAALATSSFYLSVARSMLLWWPLWLLLARAADGRRWAHAAYLSLAAPLMAVGVVAFVQGHWVG